MAIRLSGGKGQAAAEYVLVAALVIAAAFACARCVEHISRKHTGALFFTHANPIP